MKEDYLEYREMKEFLSFFADRYFKVEGLTPEKRPIASLEVLEKSSMRRAFAGLRQAINDCVEMSYHFDYRAVADLDAQLRSNGLVTLSELRRRYSKNYANIMKRGQIKNEAEYYLVRNIMDDLTEKSAEEREVLEHLISDYERA